MTPEINNLYIAPGDNRLRIDSETFNLQLSKGAPVNFMRPSADPLFRSVADAFGVYCIGIIMTGLGKDGSQGAKRIIGRDGKILIQTPETCVAPFMPKTGIESVPKHQIVPLAQMAETINRNTMVLSKKNKVQHS